MRLNLHWKGWDLLDVSVQAKKNDLLDIGLRVLVKRPVPPAPAPKDEGDGFHRGSSLADSSRAYVPEPDTRVFGFGRRR